MSIETIRVFAIVMVAEPATIQPFNRSASQAVTDSNPVEPLPEEYPDDQAFFTVTFYFNETP